MANVGDTMPDEVIESPRKRSRGRHGWVNNWIYYLFEAFNASVCLNWEGRGVWRRCMVSTDQCAINYIDIKAVGQKYGYTTSNSLPILHRRCCQEETYPIAVPRPSWLVVPKQPRSTQVSCRQKIMPSHSSFNSYAWSRIHSTCVADFIQNKESNST